MDQNIVTERKRKIGSDNLHDCTHCSFAIKKDRRICYLLCKCALYAGREREKALLFWPPSLIFNRGLSECVITTQPQC